MTEIKKEPKQVFKNDRVPEALNTINQFIEELLADPDAKTPLVGTYIYSIDFPFPRMYNDFSRTYSSSGDNTTLGEARIVTLRSLGGELFIIKNAKINDAEKSHRITNKPRAWKCAKAQYDLMNGTGHTSDGVSEYFFSSLTGTSPQEIVREMNEIMIEENSGIWINELWEMPVDESLFVYEPGVAIPKVANDHVSAVLTGFAYEDYDAVVMLNIVGYKATNDSLIATARGGKGFSLKNATYKFPSREVKTITEPVPSISLHHTTIVAREAVPGMYKPGDTKTYVLTFDKVDPQADAKVKFMRALDTILVHPLEDEWTDTLWDAAVKSGFIKSLRTGGDVKGGIVIYSGRDWDTLLDNLREAGMIKITEVE